MHPSRRPRRPPWGCECYTHNANVLLLLSTCNIELLLGCTLVWRVLSQMFCNRRWPAACSGLSHSVVHLPVIPMQLHDEASYYHPACILVSSVCLTSNRPTYLAAILWNSNEDFTHMQTERRNIPTRCRNGAKEAHLLVCICNYCFWGIYLGKLAQQGYEQLKNHCPMKYFVQMWRPLVLSLMTGLLVNTPTNFFLIKNAFIFASFFFPYSLQQNEFEGIDGILSVCRDTIWWFH